VNIIPSLHHKIILHMCDYLLGLEIEIIRHLEKLRTLTCSEWRQKFFLEIYVLQPFCDKAEELFKKNRKPQHLLKDIYKPCLKSC
jgi:hypothetical protein